ncbi:hypothetical protein QQ045_020604 [Rhodiola kirilowii]
MLKTALSMAALVTLKHLLQKNVKCRNLLENDAGVPQFQGPLRRTELDGSSQPTPNEELLVDASKSSPEMLLAVQATKTKYRVKQPIRRVRGRAAEANET